MYIEEAGVYIREAGVYIGKKRRGLDSLRGRLEGRPEVL